ncbi:hypothetical protein CSUB01_11916 [Colletotrichum sublineola]|uniref:Uncharacterized protein n=1 Tax=Colletotrichum sublineola TaxID=1173701 RepID=A0A066XRS3_COLSU|nr:hypothetical protein CSUB01_11916 [Colletotrichum sublineola]
MDRHDNLLRHNLYGTPTPVLTGNAPTGDCFPPSFTINVPYRTDGDCPTGYTRACATAGPDRSGKPVSSVTCCPRDHEYGCHATATPGAVWTGVNTDLGIAIPTEQPITRTPFTVEGLEAWGIKMISVAPTPSTSTAASSLSTTMTTPTTTTETGTSTTQAPATTSIQSDGNGSSAGISSGAIAGVAIGSAALMGILILFAFLIHRNKRKRRSNETNYVSENGNTKGIPIDRYVYPEGVNDGKVHEAPLAPAQRTWELQG